jgi:coenzyme F420-reducing hydrogenase alpha subunit
MRRRIKVSELARVEGEGALHIRIDDGRVASVRLEIFEPPRFFEAFLRGRHGEEAPDLTARICGICPVAYQMSAAHAIEDAYGVRTGDRLRRLRRLLYCGEWIESHALHVFMLHAPDFAGCQSAIELAGKERDLVRRGLRLKRLGNHILRVLGGREIHPVNVRVGGFYRIPDAAAWTPLREELSWAEAAARQTVRWAAGLPFPELEREVELVSLRHPSEYPMNEGRIVSSAGLDIPVDAFLDHFEETHVAHSTALHGRRTNGGSYQVGPLARFGLNADRLPEPVRALADEVGLTAPCTNPFKSIVVRSLELYYAVLEAARILGQELEEPEDTEGLGDAFVTVAPSETTTSVIGHGATEAPRGLLYHRYRLDSRGLITDAIIVPPTSQNQPTIEADIRAYVEGHTHLADDELQWRCEQAIRNHDPCISCATHHLELRVERSD